MRRTWFAVLALAVSSAGAAGEGPLRVLEGGHPRAFFFRAAEGYAANSRVDYPKWEATFRRLMGIEGKVLDEEVPGRSVRNVDFFTRFKRAHGDQMVLLHYNGNARDPRWRRGGFFAGHWVYYTGAKILDDVPAREGETEIRVDKPDRFRTGIGRYQRDNDDIGLCELDASGRPDWSRCEQVQVISVDRGKGTIRVRRGCYGTRVRAFRASKSYAAAHVAEGPWGRRSHLMWYYNYSTRSPRDARGRSCVDVHAADLAGMFLPGGRLAEFDGVEFDVLFHGHFPRGKGRTLDCDADTKGDNGVFDGVNTYGVGVVEFLRALRKKLPDKLLLADGHSVRNQRGFGLLNGIESEGWPDLRDHQVRDWSGGMNRHGFWASNAHRPAWSYINHKYTQRGSQPGVVRRPEVPWNIHRLVFAAAVLTDSAVCYSFPPPKEAGEVYGIWDELQMGRSRRVGWLGRPVGPAVRLALGSADLLDGVGSPVGRGLLGRLDGAGAEVALDGGVVKVTSARDGADALRLRLLDVPVRGPDLFVSVTARASPMRGYPPEVARLMHVEIADAAGGLVRPQPPRAGMCIRGGDETAIDAASGAAVRYVREYRVGGVARVAYFVHPPYRGGRTGYAFWTRDVRVPNSAQLSMFLGMGTKSPTRSDGVTFRVAAAVLDGEKAGAWTPVFQHVQKATEWTRHCVAMDKWAGKRVRLKFISDAGPSDNATTDHSYWGDVSVAAAGRTAGTRPERFMTWVNAKDFQSGFYFSDIRGKTVDLAFEVEGGRPVWISRLSVHAHADTMCRRFGNGLVLANPSPRPQVFDLSKLAGGMKLRRLRASSRQDGRTNDGSAVDAKVTLAGKDGLFLVRRDAVSPRKER